MSQFHSATRLSRLQRRILAWLLAEAQRTRGTMAATGVQYAANAEAEGAAPITPR